MIFARGSKIISFILLTDETNLFYSHKNTDLLCNTMNRELQKITSWFTSLSLNYKKTHFMIFKLLAGFQCHAIQNR